MVYPSWYPDCQSIAVDVTTNSQINASQVTAQINATSGQIIIPVLANTFVWAGFPSVNQVNPRVVAFAGQFKGQSNYTTRTSTISG